MLQPKNGSFKVHQKCQSWQLPQTRKATVGSWLWSQGIANRLFPHLWDGARGILPCKRSSQAKLHQQQVWCPCPTGHQHIGRTTGQNMGQRWCHSLESESGQEKIDKVCFYLPFPYLVNAFPDHDSVFH